MRVIPACVTGIKHLDEIVVFTLLALLHGLVRTVGVTDEDGYLRSMMRFRRCLTSGLSLLMHREPPMSMLL